VHSSATGAKGDVGGPGSKGKEGAEAAKAKSKDTLNKFGLGGDTGVRSAAAKQGSRGKGKILTPEQMDKRDQAVTSLGNASGTILSPEQSEAKDDERKGQYYGKGQEGEGPQGKRDVLPPNTGLKNEQRVNVAGSPGQVENKGPGKTEGTQAGMILGNQRRAQFLKDEKAGKIKPKEQTVATIEGPKVGSMPGLGVRNPGAGGWGAK
jgi:hypothetical protein